MLRTFQQTRTYGAMNCVENMLISMPHRKMTVMDSFKRTTRADVEKAEDLLEFVGFTKTILQIGVLEFWAAEAVGICHGADERPTVLLLDEPTAGINPTLINGLIDRLQRAIPNLASRF